MVMMTIPAGFVICTSFERRRAKGAQRWMHGSGRRSKSGKMNAVRTRVGGGEGLRYLIYDVIEGPDEVCSWTLGADNPVNRWLVTFIRSRVHLEMFLLSCCGFL